MVYQACTAKMNLGEEVDLEVGGVKYEEAVKDEVKDEASCCTCCLLVGVWCLYK